MSRDIKPIDALGARLSQAQGVLAAMSVNYDTDEETFALSDKCMNAAIWAVQELLDQAVAAYEAVATEGGQ